MLADAASHRVLIERQLRESSECLLLSAFFTDIASDWILQHRPAQLTGRLLVRGLVSDFLGGACSISAIRNLISGGFEARFLPSLHAKSFLFDETLFVGSANLTGKGLGLVNNSNDEIMAQITISSQQRFTLERLWDRGALATPATLELMAEFLSSYNVQHPNSSNLEWPTTILSKDLDIWCADFPNLVSTQEWEMCDLRRNLAYQWLLRTLVENRKMSFGELSSALHSALRDDPGPFRKTVKELLSNLLELVERLDDEVIEVARPSYRQVIQLRGVIP